MAAQVSGTHSSMGSDTGSNMVKGGGGDRAKNIGEKGVGVHRWTFKGKYYGALPTEKKNLEHQCSMEHCKHFLNYITLYDIFS